jgi:hypothetical protein
MGLQEAEPEEDQEAEVGGNSARGEGQENGREEAAEEAEGGGGGRRRRRGADFIDPVFRPKSFWAKFSSLVLSTKLH